jgi:hypothetical protein
MSPSPDVIRASLVITRPVDVVRPITNLDRDGTRITTVVGPAIIRASSIIWASSIIGSSSIIWPVAWVCAVISFATHCTERGRDQNQPEQ